ncbi:hypothetical protein ISN45_Aa02g016690 [Arabidopsis thaliana x Arabidopsis arenosa]|uniref:KIB1-4 beta-propeller domain-containing protein n=1 Tax=Arabidopsis thaliana x Arabidopsis arenosa TaxID=1240361 RepID=A0A8T2BHP6_9BRAS|nr:hypothetical protein ISN45_Aa02g016690 [Arabidopsis thaliana x Arabidopsis arenosa]
MSQLLCRISKLSSARNHFLCFRRSEFSTSTAAAATPYLLLGDDVVGKSPCGGKVVNFNLYDPRKQEQVKIENKILSKEVSKSRRIGSSRGWLALVNKKDLTVRLTNILNPSKKIISLPPITRDKYEHHVNVSVSSSNEEDCVVAVKFYGSRVSLCRPGDSEWTRIDVPCPSFHSSTVIYSERDRRFYLNNCNPDYTGPTDFTPKTGLPTPQLVESASGQSFIVLWFVERYTDKGEVATWGDARYINSKDLCRKTHKIMVFRQDEEQGIGPYTDDIGDLCIFLGENESFCLSAKDFPGLNPNSVYFAGHSSGFGICDLASRTIRYLSDSTPPPGRMFWLPPTMC